MRQNNGQLLRSRKLRKLKRKDQREQNVLRNLTDETEIAIEDCLIEDTPKLNKLKATIKNSVCDKFQQLNIKER